MEVKITERGWAGHSCNAHKCWFRRNTLLECGRNAVVVSTVGAMIDGDGDLAEIGPRRYYETMAFGAKKCGPYLDADPNKEITIDGKWYITADSYEDLPDDVDNVANQMHEDAVKEVSEMLNHSMVAKE